MNSLKTVSSCICRINKDYLFIYSFIYLLILMLRRQDLVMVCLLSLCYDLAIYDDTALVRKISHYWFFSYFFYLP